MPIERPPCPCDPAAPAGPAARPEASGRSGARVLLVDRQRLFRQALRVLLETEPDLTVVGEAGSAAEGARLAAERQPDIALVDLALAEDGGFVAIDDILRLAPATRVIALAATGSGRGAVAALAHGARGIVPKDTPVRLLLRSLQAVQSGDVWISRRLAAEVVEELTRSRTGRARGRSAAGIFTAREREILLHVTAGCTNREIADRCGLGEDTVKHHLTRMFAKTGTRSRLDLAMQAGPVERAEPGV